MDRILRANERMCRCKHTYTFILDLMCDTWMFFFHQGLEEVYSGRVTYLVQAHPDQPSHVQEIHASGRNLLMVLCIYLTSSPSFMVSNIFIRKCMPCLYKFNTIPFKVKVAFCHR